MNYEDDELMPQDGYQDDLEDMDDDFYEEEDDFYDDEDSFETGLDGMDEDDYYEDDEDDFIEEVEYLDEDYDGYEDSYDDYKATSIGTIDSNDRTLTFVVKNESDTIAKAVLFAANQGASLTQGTGVSVDVSESSHSIVRNEIFSGAFVIKGVKMSVSDQAQFDQVINITDRNATGTNASRVWQPRTSTSPQNLNPRIIDDSTVTVEVKTSTSLEFSVLPNSTIVFTFNILARVNMGNLLKGKNVAEVTRAPRITGLPQLDLLKKKKSKPRVRKRVMRVPRGKRSRVRSRFRPSRGRRKFLRRRRR